MSNIEQPDFYHDAYGSLDRLRELVATCGAVLAHSEDMLALSGIEVPKLQKDVKAANERFGLTDPVDEA